MTRTAHPLRALANVGPATERDLHLLGIRTEAQLRAKDPLALYRRLCRATGQRQDPCVLDTFLALVHNARTGERRPWFSFTKERKRRLGDAIAASAPRRLARRPCP